MTREIPKVVKCIVGGARIEVPFNLDLYRWFQAQGLSAPRALTLTREWSGYRTETAQAAWRAHIEATGDVREAFYRMWHGDLTTDAQAARYGERRTGEEQGPADAPPSLDIGGGIPGL